LIGRRRHHSLDGSLQLTLGDSVPQMSIVTVGGGYISVMLAHHRVRLLNTSSSVSASLVFHTFLLERLGSGAIVGSSFRSNIYSSGYMADIFPHASEKRSRGWGLFLKNRK
jgi:hypothetical protein